MEHKSTTPAAQPVQPAPYAAGTGSAPLLNREAEFACMRLWPFIGLSIYSVGMVSAGIR